MWKLIQIDLMHNYKLKTIKLLENNMRKFMWPWVRQRFLCLKKYEIKNVNYKNAHYWTSSKLKMSPLQITLLNC